MRTLLFIIISITSIVTGTSGCTADPIADACKRADDCNALNGSVEECTENYTSALDTYPASQQDEFRHDLEDCLDHPSCSAFVACVNALVN
ncbi:MAG: hypothetical protein ABI467_06815 [Kofleriaceae bacterium]